MVSYLDGSGSDTVDASTSHASESEAWGPGKKPERLRARFDPRRLDQHPGPIGSTLKASMAPGESLEILVLEPRLPSTDQ
jgi:hypothetical protein